MNNLRRALIFITIVFLVTASVIGFGLALNYKWISGSAKSVDLLPEGTKYENTDNPEATPQKAQTDERMCFLTVLGSSQDDTCDIIFTTTFDFTENKITNVFYPPEITVTKKNDDGTFDFEILSEIYRLQGMTALTSAVEGFLSIDINGELYMDYVSFANFISYFTSRDEGILYNIPVTINARNEKNEKVYIEKGENVLSGSKAVQLLKFYKTYDDVYEGEMANFYDGTRFRQTEIAATFIEEYIKQKLVGEIDSYYNDYYLYFINKFLTEVTNSLPEAFVTKINESFKNISKDSVNSYIIGNEKIFGANFSYYKFNGKLDKVINNGGKIIKNTLSDKQLKEIASNLY